MRSPSDGLRVTSGRAAVAPTHRLGPHTVLVRAASVSLIREADERQGPASARSSPTIRHEMHDAPLPDLVLTRDQAAACATKRARSSRGSSGRSRPRPAARRARSGTSRPTPRSAGALRRIPVVELGDRRLELATTPAKIRRLLGRPARHECRRVSGDRTSRPRRPRRPGSSASCRRASCHSCRPTSGSSAPSPSPASGVPPPAGSPSATPSPTSWVSGPSSRSSGITATFARRPSPSTSRRFA